MEAMPAILSNVLTAALADINGGAIRNEGGTLVCIDSHFEQNQANNNDGGAIEVLTVHQEQFITLSCHRFQVDSRLVGACSGIVRL